MLQILNCLPRRAMQNVCVMPSTTTVPMPFTAVCRVCMRSAPANFTPEQLTGVIYAHARGRKVYLTMNTLPTNEEADQFAGGHQGSRQGRCGCFIVADLGVLDACKTLPRTLMCIFPPRPASPTGQPPAPPTKWAQARGAGARR